MKHVSLREVDGRRQLAAVLYPDGTRWVRIIQPDPYTLGPQAIGIRLTKEQAAEIARVWDVASADLGYDELVKKAQVQESLHSVRELRKRTQELEKRNKELEEQLAAANRYGDVQATLATELRDIMQTVWERRSS